jgi:hypothetical protein
LPPLWAVSHFETKIQSEVEYYVALGLAAADEHGAFGWRFNRVGVVADGADDKPGLAGVADAGSA